MHCADCGTKYSDGLCPNCHEEAFILLTQNDDSDDGFSEEFTVKAADQRRAAQAATGLQNDKG